MRDTRVLDSVAKCSWLIAVAPNRWSAVCVCIQNSRAENDATALSAPK